MSTPHPLLVYAREVLNTGSDPRTASCKRDTDTLSVKDPVLHPHARLWDLDRVAPKRLVLTDLLPPCGINSFRPNDRSRPGTPSVAF